MTATDASRVGAAPVVYRWRWVALFVILAAEVMDMLDAMITSIAAPSIRADLGGSASTVQWLGAAEPRSPSRRRRSEVRGDHSVSASSGTRISMPPMTANA
jgi:hypothetical protein